jgi:hypothetical protein
LPAWPNPGRVDDSLGSRHELIAYASAAWALIFGVFHFVWAGGWYIGLDPVQAQAAFAVPWKLWYDVVAGVMCVIAVPVALALALPWGRRVPRRILMPLAWTGTGLLMLRAVASLVQAAYFLVTGKAASGRWACGSRGSIWAPRYSRPTCGCTAAAKSWRVTGRYSRCRTYVRGALAP